MPAIVVKNLTKKYGGVIAVNALTFSVEKGELFGFIGPDGAGKTSLFRILTTLLLPDAGEASVNNLDVVKDYKKLRTQLGYMPGRFSLYQDLSVEENLKFFASVFGTTIEENYDLIKDIYVQIEPFKKRRAGQLSGGMKQKLALSCALIHKPEILFLDEPTTGVDAVSRKEFWEMLKRLQQKGITVVVSTPYMDEASLCGRIALIQNGKILGIDTPNNIVKTFDKPLLAVKARNTHALIEALRKYPHMHSLYPFGEFLHYTDKRVQFSNDEIHDYLTTEMIQQIEMKPIEPNIEDCFMALMEKQDHE
ncbi:ABC transporter ATP-binding protein [bacterium]|nr:ABC transporter ATP-binding protein [bacterium]